MSAPLKWTSIALGIFLSAPCLAATNELPLSLPDFASPILAPLPDQQATGGVPAAQTVIPLPPAAWTGMVGLATLGIASYRKSLRRFLS